MKIKITYMVDSEDWSDAKFEDECESPREFFITGEMISGLLRSSGGLKKNETLHEIEDIKVEF